MSYTELIDVLYDCRESRFFGQRNLQLTEKRALKEVLKLVRPKFDLHGEVVYEIDSADESSGSKDDSEEEEKNAIGEVDPPKEIQYAEDDQINRIEEANPI